MNINIGKEVGKKFPFPMLEKLGLAKSFGFVSDDPSEKDQQTFLTSNLQWSSPIE
jgi:hypothetical protein